MEVPTNSDVWQQMAGVFEDDPLFDEWQSAIREYRKQLDDSAAD